MPVLDDPKNKHLSFHEAAKRLKKDPNDPDPEVQAVKKTLESLGTIYLPRISEIIELNNLAVKSLSNALVDVNFEAISSMIKSFNETANTPLKIYQSFAETFTIPTYIFESLQNIAETVRQLTEPSRILIESYAMFETPAIFARITDLQTNWIVNAPTIEEPKIRTEEEYKQEIIKEEKLLSGEVSNIEILTPQIANRPYFYYPRTKTFLIKVVDYAAVVLYTKRDMDGIAAFFEICFDFLETLGQVAGDVIKVFIPLKDLQSRLVAKGIKDPNMNWIKNTKSNLFNHKIPDFLHTSIGISDYDPKNGGYYFWIRLDASLPKLG